MDAQFGELLWRYSAEIAGASTPVVADGVVYAGTENLMNAWDAATGELLWRFETDGLVWGGSIVNDGMVYFGPFSRHLDAVDDASGILLWRRDMPDNEVGAIALVDGVLIATTRNGPVLGFNAATGERVWEYHPDGNPDVPLVDGMSVYLPVHTPSERYLIALDHTSGEAVARFQVDQNILPHTVRNGVLFASTIDIRGDRVEPGRPIYAVDARTGDVLWAFEPGGTVGPTLHVDGGRLYSGAQDGSVFAVDAKIGTLRWTRQFPGESILHTSASGGEVYALSSHGFLYALDAADGRVLWQYETVDPFLAPPVASHGIVDVNGFTDLVAVRPPGAGPAPAPVPRPTPAPGDMPITWPQSPVVGRTVAVGWRRIENKENLHVKYY